jgi:predicted NAD/FAD-dependent oxidoreductase
MAQGLDIRLERAAREIRIEEKWVHVDGDFFDAVVCSVPPPQLAGLLSWKDSPVVYAPCLTVFFEYEGGRSGLAGDRYALSDSGVEEDLYWSSCENHKRGRIREGFSVFVVHASEIFSQKHLEEDSSIYVPLLQKQLEEKWHLDPDRLKSTFAHRWRYARPVEKNPYPAIPPRLFLCGDGLVKARIEDVWLSGIKAAGEVSASIL